MHALCKLYLHKHKLISYREFFFCRNIMMLSRLLNFAFWMLMRFILRESCSLRWKRRIIVINFPVSWDTVSYHQTSCNDIYDHGIICAIAVSRWQASKIFLVTRDIAMRPSCAYSLCATCWWKGGTRGNCASCLLMFQYLNECQYIFRWHTEDE